jgi:hypothetical protein
MALNKNTLKTAMEAAFTAQINKTENQSASISDLADKIAAAIDTFVKSGTVTGTCATPAGAGTINGIIQ